MRPVAILIISKRILALVIIAAVMILLAVSFFLRCFMKQTGYFADPGSGIIVIDPGHGGIDGGVGYGGVSEKDINLSIALKLKVLLEQQGYMVVMTRDEDVSLDYLNHSSSSRHKRDLNARADIINSSNAQLFISIHVNSSSKGSAKGSVVFYHQKFEQNKTLAYAIQRALNAIVVNDVKRPTHDPLKQDYYILGNSDIPGVIVETAFLTNKAERALLQTDEFQDQVAGAIADGTIQYLQGSL